MNCPFLTIVSKNCSRLHLVEIWFPDYNMIDKGNKGNCILFTNQKVVTPSRYLLQNPTANQ